MIIAGRSICLRTLARTNGQLAKDPVPRLHVSSRRDRNTLTYYKGGFVMDTKMIELLALRNIDLQHTVNQQHKVIKYLLKKTGVTKLIQEELDRDW